MKKFFYLSLVLAGLFATSCGDDDPPLADNTVNFSATELGISETESSKSFTINIDRTESSDVTININVTATGVVYGNDFTTTPAAAGNAISATIKAGSTSTTVEVKKLAKLLDGDESINFEIGSATGGLVLGEKKSLKLTFGAIISTGSTMTLQGGEGGSAAVNSVFVDFSGNEQTSVARASWNFGFSTGADFAVILNNTTGSTAVEATNQNLETIISETAATEYANKLKFGQEGAFDIIDDISGDLTKSVIKEGKVYIVNLGDNQTPLYKVKVTKKDADTYTIQYAKSNESAVKSINISKNAAYNFMYASITEGKVVNVQPEKAKWDIEWTRTAYKTGTYPYFFSDFVYINAAGGIQAAEVLTSVTEYAKYSTSDVASTKFSSEIDVIGSKWRNGGGPNKAPSIKEDRFYVIKDGAGNIYKLRFTSMGKTRGYPEIEYALVK